MARERITVVFERRYRVQSQDAFDDFPPTIDRDCDHLHELSSVVVDALRARPDRELRVYAVDRRVATEE